MPAALRLYCLMFLLCWPAIGAAEREVHVVSIANGTRDTADLMSIHEAHVHVSRPDKSVVLVLVDRGPLTWRVTLGPSTALETIWLGGDTPNQSDVFLHDTPIAGAEVVGVPVALQPDGLAFRELVSVLSDRTGMGRITSFYGAYAAPLDGIVVDRAENVARYGVHYLGEAIGPSDDLPDALARWTPQSAPASQARFDEAGFEVALPAETLRFDVPEGIPAIRFPMAAVFDPTGGAAYGMTLGGIGHLYRVDTATGAWRVLSDQDNFDGAQMLFDETGQRLIMTGAFSRPGEFRITPLDGRSFGFTLPVRRFAGLTDLYDYGNDDPPNLVPHFVAGDWVAVTAGNPEQGAFRAYAVNLETQDIRLLAFRDAP